MLSALSKSSLIEVLEVLGQKVDQINRVDSASGDDLLAVLKVGKSYRVSRQLPSIIPSLVTRSSSSAPAVCMLIVTCHLLSVCCVCRIVIQHITSC